MIYGAGDSMGFSAPARGLQSSTGQKPDYTIISRLIGGCVSSAGRCTSEMSSTQAMHKTTDLAAMVMYGWHESSRLTKQAYRQMGEIAQKCAEELGDEMPDNAMTHGLISAWLRKQKVEAR